MIEDEIMGVDKPTRSQLRTFKHLRTRLKLRIAIPEKRVEIGKAIGRLYMLEGYLDEFNKLDAADLRVVVKLARARLKFKTILES
jgi:hypothetical protein